MFEKLIIMLLICSGFTAFSGLIERGRVTAPPEIFTHKFMTVIAQKHFPEIRKFMPEGLSRQAAWTQDIRKAAQKYNLKPEQVEPLLQFVLNYYQNVTSAPHPELLEFELYARGKYELFYRAHTQMPRSWQKLLDLPLEKRRYTTIPVLRAYAFYREYHGGSLAEREQIYQRMLYWKKQGCEDTQGCIPDLLNRISRNPKDYTEWQIACKMLFRKVYANYRYLENSTGTSEIHTARQRHRADEADTDLLWTIYLESEENLRKMCQSDPALRDLIVLIGLTNTEARNAQKVAREFYKQSVINYPAAAVKLPLEEGIKLLENYPEHRFLRDNLIILSLKGKARIDAIDKYLSEPLPGSTYDSPFYTLYDRMFLEAMAGAEWFYLGQPHKAAERWINGCFEEDMAIVAEQVMTIEELKNFCVKHFPDPVKLEGGEDFRDRTPETYIYSILLHKDQLNFLVRNILARRLMRAGRFEEARSYFTGVHTRKRSEKFFALQKILNSPETSKSEKINAMLNMAALVRFDGDRLFGTHLEPDNLICRNRYANTWGKNQKFVKLNKEDLPRYSYRYRAAKLYEKAADMTSDRKVKALALWTAGSILKNLSPKTADHYFKKLYRVAPEMTVKNWFLPIKKASGEQQAFYNRRLFLNGSIENYMPVPPAVIPVKLPLDVAKDTEKLLNSGLNAIPDDNCINDWETARGEYALRLLGDKGNATADLLNAMLHSRLENYETALWYLRRVPENDKVSGLAKFETGRHYILLGHHAEGLKIVEEVAADNKDKPAQGNAAFFLAQVYYQVKKDPVKGKYYLDLARACGLEKALHYTPPKSSR